MRRLLPGAGVLRRDAIAGIPGAIGSVPDGMAASVLAGVNPVHGLYASFAGPLAGGLTASTRLMVITTTSAAALAAGSALSAVTPADRPRALFLLTVLAGVAMAAAGVVRLGRATRFVAHSVMIGFLSGVAANIVFGQLPALLGASSEGPFALAKALDVALHPGRIDGASSAVGGAAIATLVVLARTPASSIGAVLALVVPTAVLEIVGDSGVARVEDAGSIPTGLPAPAFPDFGALNVGVVTGALAVAAIVLIQGAGVREVAPNPRGQPSSVNRDFIAQGVANVAAGLFKGQPVGGSVGQTSLNVAAGARSRWAAIFSGVWMLVILALLTGPVGRVAMPTLAGVLIVAALGALRPGEWSTILRAGPQSLVALATTFLATLLLPIAAAVGIGIVLSLMMQLNREAVDLRVVERVPLPDAGFLERDAPARLDGREVTILDVYGSLLFAGARTLQSQLPDPDGATRPVVILRLRGRVAVGATFIVVVERYAERLRAVGGRLLLSGVDPGLLEQLERTGAVEPDADAVFLARPVVGESTREAYEEARRWRDAEA
jgi:sulfate permease, SulP family